MIPGGRPVTVSSGLGPKAGPESDEPLAPVVTCVSTGNLNVTDCGLSLRASDSDGDSRCKAAMPARAGGARAGSTSESHRGWHSAAGVALSEPE